MFFFHHWLLLLFFAYFHCWFHLFISPTSGFFITVSSGIFISPLTFTIVFHKLCLTWPFFCQVLRFCVGVTRVLRIWESSFYSSAFFTLHFFPTFATIPRVLRIWESFSNSQVFLPYTLFQYLAQPAFIKASLGTCSSSLKVAGSPTEVGSAKGISQ